jgi:hypothetical protein
MTKNQIILRARLEAIDACSRIRGLMLAEGASPEEIMVALEELARQVAELSGNPIL